MIEIKKEGDRVKVFLIIPTTLQKFSCKACGYTLNADLVGARNIERKAREFRYMRDSLGCCQPPERPFEGQAPFVRAG